MSNNKQFAIVTFENGEQVKAIYADGILVTYGDYYHDKIDEFIIGFFEALDFIMFSYTQIKYKCLDEELNEVVVDHGDPPPHELKDVKLSEL